MSGVKVFTLNVLRELPDGTVLKDHLGEFWRLAGSKVVTFADAEQYSIEQVRMPVDILSIGNGGW